MVNLKPAVFTALCAALPGGRVCFIGPEDIPDRPEAGEDDEEAPAPDELPFITFSETDNAAGIYADDVEYSSIVEYTVGVWGDSSEQITPIAQAVDEQMQALGFGRAGAVDVPRDSEGTLQKAMRYIISA